MTALIGELGMAHDLRWARPRTVTLRGGKLHRLDSVGSLLGFSPLPARDRLRMGLALAYLRLLPSARTLEGKTASAWIRSRMGAAAYDTVWAPLLTAKFGDRAASVSLPWFWARVKDRTQELGYVHGGFQRFYNRLAERLRHDRVTLRLSTEVTRVSAIDGGLTVAAAAAPDRSPQTETFDQVISTLPTRVTCRLVPDLPAAFRSRYEWGEALGAHCLILSLRRSLTNAYWVNVNDPGYPFMVLVEHTNYMAPEDYGGRHLVYLGNYRPMADPLFQLTLDQVIERCAPYLSRFNPAFDRSWIANAWMFAAPYAQPIVTTDYPAHIPPFHTPLLGLHLANMFQVYPHDRGQNYSVALAQALVHHLETEQ
jgi:protoporphyrinogen oxidase